jgi:hypothetical protein
MAQADASHPLEKLQRPETRTPPAAGSAVPPSGLRQVEASVSGPLAKKSSCACAGTCPSHAAAPQLPRDRVARVDVRPVAAVAGRRADAHEPGRQQVLHRLRRDLAQLLGARCPLAQHGDEVRRAVHQGGDGGRAVHGGIVARFDFGSAGR